jgi:hypothetical protein
MISPALYDLVQIQIHFAHLFTTCIILTLILHRKQTKKNTLLHGLLLQQHFEAKRLESHTITNKMLAHRLNPMQTQGVQHGTRTLHDTQYHDGACEPKVEDGHHEDGALDAGEGECVLHGHVPEDDGETLMGEGEGPETEVGCSVGDAVEAEFWRFVSNVLKDVMCVNLPMV